MTNANHTGAKSNQGSNSRRAKRRRSVNRGRLARILRTEQLETRQLLAADFGDAPASFGIASHEEADFGPRLGAIFDTESASQHSSDASGDDSNGLDDEDGVTFGSLGSSISLERGQFSEAFATNTGEEGFINLWIDFNRDGQFDSSEEVLDPLQRRFMESDIVRSLEFAVPADAQLGQTIARVRVSSLENEIAFAAGSANSGEVEDYLVTIVDPPPPTTVAIVATNADVDEGDAGLTPFTFTVNRTGPSATVVDFEVSGSGANPASADDFADGVLASGQVTFTESQTSQTITVMVNGDTDSESDEGFSVTLLGATNDATVSTATASGVIRNDDVALPVLSVTAPDPVTEGDDAVFVVSLDSAPAAGTTSTVSFNIVDGTAVASEDYTELAGAVTLTFTDTGPLSQTVTIETIDDDEVESDETIVLGVVAIAGDASISIGPETDTTATIVDNDALPVLSVTAPDPVTEGDDAVFVVSLDSAPAAGTTSTVSFNIVDGTAVASEDYTELAGAVTLTFTDTGPLSQTVTIETIDDDEVESDETIVLGVVAIAGDASISIGPETDTTATIVDNDAPEPMTFVVDNLTDEVDDDFSAGDLSLREALALSDASTGVTDTITFADTLDGQTIDLTLGELTINDGVIVRHDGDSRVTIDAAGNSRVLTIPAESTFDVTLSGLVITGGATTDLGNDVDTDDDGGDGGGIRSFTSGTLTIENSVVTGNSTSGDEADGGGIFARNGTLDLVASTVSDNTTSGSYVAGGGIYSEGILTITDSTISGNVQTDTSDDPFVTGGGIFNQSLTGQLTLTNSTVSGNSSLNGGGIANYGMATITHSTITLNEATSGGGGIGGFYGQTQVGSAIVAGNVGDDVRFNMFTSLGHNVIGSGDAVNSFTAVGDQTFVTDPMLEALADNGGPTQTHAPVTGSPVIDAGDSTAMAGSGGVPEFDQRGLNRVVGTIDVGSFEVQPANTDPTISDITDQTVDFNTATLDLPFTIGDAETDLDSLTVTVTSSDQTLVPDANVVLGGSGADRTVTVTPATDQSGTATITVTVTDEGGATATDTFDLTVNVAGNTAPTISDIGNQTVDLNTATSALPFTIGDAETDLDSLIVTVTSSDQTLVPDANAVLGGSGADRTVTVTPATDQSGTATITVTVTDEGGATATDTFDVTVTAPDAPAAVISPTGPGGEPDPADLDGVPQPSSWAIQRSTIREITVNLSSVTVSVTASDLVLTNLTTNEVITLRDDQLSLSSDGLQLRVTLDAGQLGDGAYQLDLLSGITGGETVSIANDEFFVLQGDWNGSGGVNIQDFATFAYWFSNSTPTAPSYVDLNGSGGVNIQDFAGFAANFGTSIDLGTGVATSNGAGEGELIAAITTLLNPTDTNGDGQVSSSDALGVINEIGRNGSGEQVAWSPYDANGDQRVTSADALYVINRIAAESSLDPVAAPTTPEGETVAYPSEFIAVETQENGKISSYGGLEHAAVDAVLAAIDGAAEVENRGSKVLTDTIELLAE